MLGMKDLSINLIVFFLKTGVVILDTRTSQRQSPILKVFWFWLYL